MHRNWKKAALYLVTPLAVGALSGFLSRSGMSQYSTLRQPPLSPPGWLFPIVWTILYLLMGISAFLISTSDSEDKTLALQLYKIQLSINFIWPLVFFLLHWYLAAFFVLVLLWYLVILMILAFGGIHPTAAKLQLPYLIWITYAGYLNLGIFILNH